jgi:hypothetical protein
VCVCVEYTKMSTFSTPVKRRRDEEAKYKRVSYGILPQQIMSKNQPISFAFKNGSLWQRALNTQIAMHPSTTEAIGPSFEQLAIDPDCGGIFEVLRRDSELETKLTDKDYEWHEILRLQLRNLSKATLVFKTDPTPIATEYSQKVDSKDDDTGVNVLYEVVNGNLVQVASTPKKKQKQKKKKVYQFAHGWRIVKMQPRDINQPPVPALEVSYLQPANADGDAFRVMRDVNHVQIEPGEIFELDMSVNPFVDFRSGGAWHHDPNYRYEAVTLGIEVDAIYHMPTGSPEEYSGSAVMSRKVLISMHIDSQKLYYARYSGHRFTVPDGDIKMVAADANGDFGMYGPNPAREVQNKDIESDPETLDDLDLF